MDSGGFFINSLIRHFDKMKKTNKVYLIAFVSLTLLMLINPLKFILFGKRTTGIVVQIQEKRTRSTKYPGTYYYSVVEAKIEGDYYRFWGGQNIVYPIGKQVKVVYLPWGDLKVKIFDFKNLFVGSIVYIVFFFIVIGGMKLVFPDLFEPGGFDIFRK